MYNPAHQREGSLQATGVTPSLTLSSLAAVEKNHIEKVLWHVRWHKGRAAQILGIHRSTLYVKMKQYGIV